MPSYCILQISSIFFIFQCTILKKGIYLGQSGCPKLGVHFEIRVHLMYFFLVIFIYIKYKKAENVHELPEIETIQVSQELSHK